MKTSFTLLFFTLNVLISDLAFSQTGKISGTLTFDDGAPVAYASVFIQSIKKHTLSDERGRYELTDIPFGPYQVNVSSIEIQKHDFSIHIDKTNLKLSTTLKRAEDSELDEVIVEGESHKSEIEATGFAVNVIETKKASLQSLQTNDLLNRSVGVRVRQNGGLGSQVSYNLNGMSGNSVRIFIDGVPISTYGGSFSLNSIPPALIERIEVYKGVIPAHLADDALGGAINVILKKGAMNNLTASLSYGSFNTLQANMSGSFRNSNSGFTVKGSGFYNYSDNDYEVWGKFVRNILPNGRYEYVRAKRFNDAYKSIGANIQVGFTDVKWADQFLIGYNVSDDYNEIQHGTYMTIPYKGRFTESQANVVSVAYSKSNFLTKGLEVNFNGMISDRKEVVNDTVRWNYDWFGEQSIGLNGDPILRPSGAQQGAPTINHINRSISTFRGGAIYDFSEKHRLVFNHMYYTIDRTERDDLKSAIEREFIGTRDLTKNVSALAYEATLFESRFKANLFGKYYQQKIDRMDPILITSNGEQIKGEDRVSSNNSTPGYGLATSYKLKQNLTFLVSAEKAVRMPSENEIFGSPSENIIENINIRPEVSNNLNIGLRSGTYSLNPTNKFSFYVSGFLRDTKDKIVRKINPRLNDAVQTDPFENLGKTKSIGFEGEINYTWKDNLDVLLNFSKFNSVFNIQYDPNGKEYTYYNQQLPNEPFFTINTTVQYAFKNVLQKRSSLNLYYSAGFVDRFYTTWLEIEDFRTPRQFIQDIGMNYIFPNQKLVVSADLRNIFDQQAFDNFAVQKPGRGFYLKVNYTINKF
ncbi:TonB-dependent receptor [Algoriphagus aquimarinus]|uniref:Outer membrane receptor proteins, mostly Fe transport n=1 Tax=Algoriphagus aquimarinus TaxID=237018 RepID=A0A1I0YF42_9BACT|nr:TonB-dependent receptor plug domain-containing protein [Algoriphagus aquimarinus]SFB11386.1 Outer membrane receptor proteins, mostly Fe transport [Algoriphagus aquimarinus]